MMKLAAMAVAVGTVALVLTSGGAASASGGGGGRTTTSSGTWPAVYPLPVNPGTVMSQGSSTAVVRSTDTVEVVNGKLDQLYVTRMGCISKTVVNKPRNYFCTNPSTGKTDEVFFTFAALDPKPTDSSRSQSNAFLVRG
jgi:hypothetical protein